MKVLFVAASGQIGGGNRSLLMQWAGMASFGVDVHVLCPTAGPLADLCRTLGMACQIVEYHQPGWRAPFRSWESYLELQRIIAAAQPDVVHANDLHGGRFVTLARRSLGLPLVCHIRMPPHRDYASWVFRGLPKPEVFVFNSHAVKNEAGPHLRQHYPGVEQRVVHNGVDLRSFRPLPTPSDSMCRIGIIANLSPVKGHDDFLRMAKSLLDMGHSCEFWIIGTDIERSGYEAHIASTAARLGVSHAVRFLGFRSDIAAVINQLDIVVSSSHYEGFGRTLIEAMACERVVVATAVGGVPEVVADGSTGFLVAPRDANALADRVACLVQDASLRQRMGRAGRRRVQELFSIDSHISQIVDVYRHVLAGRPLITRCAESAVESHV